MICTEIALEFDLFWNLTLEQIFLVLLKQL